MRKRKNNLFLSGLVLLTVILAISCDPARKLEKQERDEIQQYVLSNNITVKPKASGLYYIEILEGVGDTPAKNDSVFVRYTGLLLSGYTFDSNLDSTDPFRFKIGAVEVIPGFEEGVTYMKKGGQAKILLPSSLAYGKIGNYYGGIPGYTPVIFELELVDLKQSPNYK
jgi:FKBP-type peptidyl-prolyl cis-trans isomerase